jgi:hypothetical protein
MTLTKFRTQCFSMRQNSGKGPDVSSHESPTFLWRVRRSDGKKQALTWLTIWDKLTSPRYLAISIIGNDDMNPVKKKQSGDPSRFTVYLVFLPHFPILRLIFILSHCWLSLILWQGSREKRKSFQCENFWGTRNSKQPPIISTFVWVCPRAEPIADSGASRDPYAHARASLAALSAALDDDFSYTHIRINVSWEVRRTLHLVVIDERNCIPFTKAPLFRSPGQLEDVTHAGIPSISLTSGIRKIAIMPRWLQHRAFKRNETMISPDKVI